MQILQVVYFPQVSSPQPRMHLSSYAYYQGTVQHRRTTYQGTDILELTTSSANILADQAIHTTLFCTCKCASAIRSGSNLVNPLAPELFFF